MFIIGIVKTFVKKYRIFLSPIAKISTNDQSCRYYPYDKKSNCTTGLNSLNAIQSILT